MSLESYDSCLRDHIKSIYENTILSDDNVLLQQGSRKEHDNNLEIKIPIIVINRLSMDPNPSQYNYTAARKGRVYEMDRNNPEKAVIYERDYPVDLQYQISIASDSRRDVDSILQELLFYLEFTDTMKGTYTGTDIPMEFQIQVLDVDMDIDPASFSETGRLYRNIVSVSIPHARLLMYKEGALVTQIPTKMIILSDNESELILTPPDH